MKRWCLFFIVLLILPTVSATMSLEGSSLKEIYNLGEKVDINIQISNLEGNTQGFLKLLLTCGETSSTLLTRLAYLTKDGGTFKESLSTIPSLTGSCHITASLEDFEGKLIEQTSSKDFTITDELDSTIAIDKNLVQLGKTVQISGSIFKKDGTNINGIATIYFKQGETIYGVDTVMVENGNFNYIFDTSSKPAGVYNIEIHASDIFGNKNLFTDLSITLTSEISITAHSSDLEASPSDTVKITGEAIDISQDPIKNADVLIRIGGKEFLTTLSGGDFSEKITIPKDIKSGKQDILVIIEDDQGNRGETNIQITIKPVQTNLEIKIPEESYDPSSDLKITPILQDQARDLIIEDISVEIFNPKGKLEFNEVVKTNEELTYTLGQYSLPGTWTIKVTSSKIDYEKTFLVNEIFFLHFELNNQILSVINRGNVKYTLPLKIELKGPERINIVKKLNLYPKETSELDLGMGIPTGTYDISVQDEEFKGIYIQGRKRPFNYDFLYYLFIGIVVLAFLWWLSKNIFKKKHRRKKHKEAPKEKPKEEFKEDYKKEYINRLLKTVQEREEKTKKELKFKFGKKPKEKFGKEAGYINIPAPKPSITNILQTTSEKPAWRILKKKGLATPKDTTTKPGLFSMFD